MWFVNIFQQYGLNFQLEHLPGELLINSGISNGTAFIACFLCYPVLLHAKRKPAQLIGFCLTLLASGAYIFVENEVLRYVLIGLMRFGICFTFILIYCFTTELYPTQIRGLAFGIANTFGRIATIFASAMVTVNGNVFMLITAFLSVLIIVLTFFLPETKGVELKDKIYEQDTIDRREERFKESVLN